MFKQYFGIITLYFFTSLCIGQINTFTVISGPDIKTLGNSIQDRKNEGYIYHVLDSLAKKPQSPNWANGANGEVYKAFIKNNALYFNSSKDGGKTWLSNDIFIDSLPKNKTNPFAQENQFAFTMCNQAMNRVYVCWSDAKFGKKNNDVFLTYSDDGGKTWLDRILITYYPNHKQQFMPRFAIDHTNGYLYFMYCSQRNFPKGNLTDVYLTVSKDNGKTFTEYKLNDAAFEWKNDASLDKYFSLSIHNGNIYPIWMQLDTKKKLLIRSTVLSDAVLKNSIPTEKIIFDRNIPHVYSARTEIKFNQDPGPYSAYLYKASDPNFEVMLNPPDGFKTGTKGIMIDFEKLKLLKGTYIAMIYNNEGSHYVWIQEE